MEALTPAQVDLRERAARFVDETLIPLELEAERNGGPLPPEKARAVSTRARELGLVGGNHAVDVGGQGWSAFEQVLVQEELGRNTNGVWWNMGGGYNVLALRHARADRALSEADAARRARRLLRGHRGRGRLRRGRHRRDGRADGGRLAHPGREVVRHLGRRVRLRHRDGERRRRRASGCRRSSSSTATGPGSRSSTIRRSRTPSRTGIPPSGTTARSTPTPCSAATR